MYVTEPSWACAGQSKAAADAATKKAIAAVREAAIAGRKLETKLLDEVQGLRSQPWIG